MTRGGAALGALARDGEALAGAALAALGVHIVRQALGWEIMGPDGPGPGFFPFGYGALMIVLSLGLGLTVLSIISLVHGNFSGALRGQLPVPVVDGVSSAVRHAETLAALQPGRALHGSFSMPPAKPHQGLPAAIARLLDPGAGRID